MSDAKAELVELERVLDEHVRQLPAVTAVPVRALLTAFHVLINGQLNRFDDVNAAQRGLAAAARLAYLVPGLLDEMAVEPFGAGATDCLQGAPHLLACLDRPRRSRGIRGSCRRAKDALDAPAKTRVPEHDLGDLALARAFLG